MKRVSLLILVLSLAGLPAMAAEGPIRHHGRGTSAPTTRPGEVRAWLGLSISSPPQSLRHQLTLPEGTGLVVDFVQPGSPADQAGVKEYDILQKLNDQLLINPAQFAVLIRLHKAGDEVKIQLLREGHEQTVTARLVDHEVPALNPDAWPGEWFETPGSPSPGGPGIWHDHPGRTEFPGFPAQRSMTAWLGDRRMTLASFNGHTLLTVTEMPGGKVLFRGPIDSETERQKLPPEIRKDLARVQALCGNTPDGPTGAPGASSDAGSKEDH